MNYESVDKKLREANFLWARCRSSNNAWELNAKENALIPIGATVANAQGAFT